MEESSKRQKQDTTSDGEWAAGIIEAFYNIPGVWGHIELSNKATSLAFVETFLNTNRIGMLSHDNETYKKIHKNIKLIQYIFLEGRFKTLSVEEKMDVLHSCGFSSKYFQSSVF
jgi:hypothetical protein